jgi:hypothetical protein
MYEVILKRFDQPDDIRTFEKGCFELVRIGGMTIGRARYEPGWRWSEHVGIAPGHDSWVIGDEPYVSLHFMGAGDYARSK